MSVHSYGPDGKCIGCVAKLEQAHPYLRRWFWTSVFQKYRNAHISWSYRGNVDQTHALNNKKTKLPWPKSAHNRRVAIDPKKPFDPLNEWDPNSEPQSAAIDLFEIIDGNPVWRSEVFHELARNAATQYFPIFWGGNWKDLGDADHFQLDLKLLEGV